MEQFKKSLKAYLSYLRKPIYFKHDYGVHVIPKTGIVYRFFYPFLVGCCVGMMMVMLLDSSSLWPILLYGIAAYPIVHTLEYFVTFRPYFYDEFDENSNLTYEYFLAEYSRSQNTFRYKEYMTQFNLYFVNTNVQHCDNICRIWPKTLTDAILIYLYLLPIHYDDEAERERKIYEKEIDSRHQEAKENFAIYEKCREKELDSSAPSP